MSNYKTINNSLARQFRALSNPHRLQIFNLLSGCCEPGEQCLATEVLSCNVSELDRQLDIASSTLSHHLKELHHADLIDMQRQGKQVYCSVNPDTLARLKEFFSSASSSYSTPQVKNDQQSTESA